MQTLRRYAATVVSYFKNDLCELAPKQDVNPCSSRVPMHVRQTFLENTEKGNLHVHRQPFRVGRKVEGYVQSTALGKALDVPLRRAAKAYLIQQRWMQQVRHGPYFLDCLICQFCHVGNKRHFGRVFFTVLLQERDTDFQRRQRLASAVVQITRQLASLLILYL